MRTRYFRQLARKDKKNFGKKREPDDSFYLFVFYQQCLVRLQLHIRQPDGSALRGVILAAQSVQTCPCRVLGKVEQSHQRFLAALAHQRQHAGVVAVPCSYPRIRGKAGVCPHLAQLLHALPQLVLQRALSGALLCILPVEFAAVQIAAVLHTVGVVFVIPAVALGDLISAVQHGEALQERHSSVQQQVTLHGIVQCGFIVLFQRLMNGSKDRLWQTLVDQHNAKLNQAQTRIKSIEADKDKRLLMGDDIHNASDRFYGNPDVMCDDYFHGTFVAGIIAAQPNPENKMIGIYPTAKIMTIRAVPEGDEYDKDIASAIRYAVDNGAKIINMSFGKQTSPDADMVEDAIHYAANHDVLLVMASGNNGTDCDKKIYYPQGLDKTGKRIDNLIRVGASDINGNPGSISNYGKNSVDIFAPGMDITSLGENNGYTTSSGTSIAAPVVAGIAAIIRDYFPKLSADQVKECNTDEL